MIQNCLDETVYIWELDSSAQEKEETRIDPGQTVPFWPSHGTETVINQ
jgi:hypothetical protein